MCLSFVSLHYLLYSLPNTCLHLLCLVLFVLGYGWKRLDFDTCVCLLSFMPRLKETYLQIVERNRREIRNRTTARLAQLAQTSADAEEHSDEESDEDGNTTQEHTSSSIASNLFDFTAILRPDESCVYLRIPGKSQTTVFKKRPMAHYVNYRYKSNARP